MRLLNNLLLLVLCLVIYHCDDNTTRKTSQFSIRTGEQSLMLGDTLELSVANPKGTAISEINYRLDGKAVDSTVVLNNVTLGLKTLTAIIKYEGGLDTISKPIKIFNNKIPSIYSYEVVNTYPHDINSYTQGLEFYRDTLFESTGQKTKSKLRKIDFSTGEVLNNLDLSDQYFGEGLTILNDKIYQLTWQSRTGFIYDVDSFEKISSFKYGKSKEGWGLCNDGSILYKSDGTEKIWLLNPDDLSEIGHIEVYTEKGKIPSLNELEWIDGKIYANIYQRNGVVIIDPKTGGVEGVIDFKPLKQKVTQHDYLDVLNGIAYNPERQTIFVTGKNWDKLFEVKIVKN